jgi:hypothetical protein
MRISHSHLGPFWEPTTRSRLINCTSAPAELLGNLVAKTAARHHVGPGDVSGYAMSATRIYRGEYLSARCATRPRAGQQ